jgi:hypothetical protein
LQVDGALEEDPVQDADREMADVEGDLETGEDLGIGSEEAVVLEVEMVSVEEMAGIDS